jgi:hypothetical protein
MTSVLILDKPVTRSTPTSLSSVVPRWILANVLPQALLVAAAGLYLKFGGIEFARLIARDSLDRLGNVGWALTAVIVVYLATIVWMRGTVLRSVLPRFSWLAWLPAALLSGAVMLLVAIGGSLVGIAIAKGIAMSGGKAPSAPEGLALIPFMLGNLIAAELIGVIVGGLPGLIIGAGEALAAWRGTRRKVAWMLWTAAAWSAVAAIVTLHGLTVVYFPALPSAALAALAGATPILIGLATALLTLPAIANMARQRNGGA